MIDEINDINTITGKTIQISISLVDFIGRIDDGVATILSMMINDKNYELMYWFDKNDNYRIVIDDKFYEDFPSVKDIYEFEYLKDLIIYIDKKPFEINLINNDELYDNLSIIIPDSKELDNNEFFLNTEIDNNIINELIKQGFIIKTEKKSIAGDKQTNSYKLNI